MNAVFVEPPLHEKVSFAFPIAIFVSPTHHGCTVGHRWVFLLAWRYLFPKKHFGTFFTWMSVTGIAAGVALLMIVLSIMNGFDTHIAEKLSQINGAIKIIARRPIAKDEVFLENIRRLPHVKAMTPYVAGISMMQVGERVALPKCLGLEVETAASVLPLERFLTKGSLNGLKDGAWVSEALAHECGLDVGDTFELYSPLALEAMKKEELLLPPEVTVAGLFKTGWAEADRSTVLLPLELAQELYALSDNVHGFSIEADRKYLGEVCRAINHLLPPGLVAYTWNTLNADFLYILKLEKAMCFFVLLFVVAVAAFSMSSGLMSAVVRKRRELALLRTWGATKTDLSLLFGLQSLLLGFLGLLTGFAGAAVILHERNTIVRGLTGWLLPKDALWNFYDVETLPAVWSRQDMLWIILLTLVMTLLASLLPIGRMYKLPPVQSLRRG